METKFFDLLFIIHKLVPALGVLLFYFDKTGKNRRTLAGFAVKPFSWGWLLGSAARPTPLKADGPRIN